jgi:Fic family protein
MSNEPILPTYKQIMYGWSAKPTARNVALVLRDFALENHNEKVTISVGKLAAITDASETGITAAIKQLVGKGFLQDTPGKTKLEAHTYTLHLGNVKNYKKHFKNSQ